ncbi:MAG: LiaF transmembrane domain-containing protein [Intestinibacter sp.]
MKRERTFWGILFILGAIALIAGKLFMFAINVFSIILAAFLMGIIIKSIPRKNFTGIMFPLAFICIIFDKQLGLTAITPWTVLIAAALISIGLHMIFPNNKNHNFDKFNFESHNFENIDTESEGYMNIQTSFAETIKYVNTDIFEKSDLRCRFGAIKMYFDNANLYNNRGIVNIDASFSGVELYIPRTWHVENRIHAVFGGVNEKNKHIGTTENTLVLVGNLSFAGVDIIYI